MQTVADVVKLMGQRVGQSTTSRHQQVGSEVGRPATFVPETAALCRPDCPVCHGLAWVRLDLPITDPMFGKLQPCPNSDPFKRYGGILGITPDEYELSWSAIVDQQDVMRAVEAVQRVLEQGYGWVFLHGSYGLGKTLVLKVAVAEFLRQTRQPASYVRMAEIIEHMRGAYNEKNPSEASAYRLDMWTDLQLLAIDEFDRVRKTEYAAERQFVLMDRRYEAACRRKPSITLMASNSNPCDFEGYLADRILDGRFEVVELSGVSARPMMSF